MLQPAILKAQEVILKFREICGNPEYRYYLLQNYVDYNMTIETDDWRRMQFASVDNEGKVRAYFEARIDRGSNIVTDLLILYFDLQKANLTASKDFAAFIYLLLREKGFEKIFFRFIKDNPAALLYKKLFIDKIKCSTIAGTLKNAQKLTDGNVYDIIIMDIEKEPYITWYENEILRTDRRL
jgi:hypothetical protein